MSYRDVGALGEDLFGYWCSTKGLSSLRSNRDRFGWDHFIEFPEEKDERSSIDSQCDLKKALVQIKSTDSAVSSARLKLTAARLLVSTDLPAFVVHYEFTDGAVPTEARLLHIGPDEIAFILRKVRECEACGRLDLHNVRISLPLGSATPLALDGSDLKEAILQFVPRTSAEYVAAKALVRSTCGFEEKPFLGEFTLQEGVTGRDFVNFLIGNKAQLPIKAFGVRKERFGITLPKEALVGGEGTISVTPSPFRECEIIASSNNLDMQCVARAIMYLANLTGLRYKLRQGVRSCRFSASPTFTMKPQPSLS